VRAIRLLLINSLTRCATFSHATLEKWHIALFLTFINMMDIAEIQTLINRDMEAVNALIHNRLQSEVVLVNQIGHYIINSGGKRLRPMLLLLKCPCLWLSRNTSY